MFEKEGNRTDATGETAVDAVVAKTEADISSSTAKELRTKLGEQAFLSTVGNNASAIKLLNFIYLIWYGAKCDRHCFNVRVKYST